MITSSILPRISSHTEAPTDNASRTSNKAAGSSTSNLSVAIIGGGIVGVVLAHGLLQRGIHVTIYERGPNFQETGASMAFTGVSREFMKILSPLVISAMNRVGVPTRRPYDNYWGGYHNKISLISRVGKSRTTRREILQKKKALGTQTAQAATSCFHAQITNSPFGAVCVNTSSTTLPPRSQQTSHVSTKSSSITRTLHPLQGHYTILCERLDSRGRCSYWMRRYLG
jgi:hypothetical protein